MPFDVVRGVLEQGLLWAPMVLGVYVTFRVLNYADLTVDGSFTLGAAIAARLIFAGGDPWLGTLLALAAGGVAGAVTGLLHTHLKIPALLSGILTMIALYSVNLRIMGRANLSLLRAETIFTDAARWLTPGIAALLLSFAFVVVVLVMLYAFLQTELGMAVRATGDNEQMIRSLGVNTGTMKVIGLSLGNALCALSGALVGQFQKFADIQMGIGMIIIGLASVIIGEVLCGAPTVWRALLAVVVGSIIYRAVVSLVLSLGLAPTDLKLLTAAIVTLALAFPVLRRHFGWRTLARGGSAAGIERRG
ncbi:MAG: ABC transporter permease [Bacillota bacterium]